VLVRKGKAAELYGQWISYIKYLYTTIFQKERIMETNQTIAACIVTYNRKDLLLRCLDSIQKQSILPDAILIVDNHSTDGTLETVICEAGFLLREAGSHGKAVLYEGNLVVREKQITLIYLYKHVNDGGAGGFYSAMAEAYSRGYGWFWLMDDDGVPHEEQLQNLRKAAVEAELDYANAMVLDISDPTKFSFKLCYKGKVLTVEEAKKIPVVYGSANPFNGTFVNRRVVDKAGFVKKEMFIWGDEREYLLRTKKCGFNVGTVTSAIHYHKGIIPTNRIRFLKWSEGKFPLDKFKIRYRNMGYINIKYYGVWVFLRNLMAYTVLYLANLRLKEMALLWKYYWKGAFNQY